MNPAALFLVLFGTVMIIAGFAIQGQQPEPQGKTMIITRMKDSGLIICVEPEPGIVVKSKVYDPSTGQTTP